MGHNRLQAMAGFIAITLLATSWMGSPGAARYEILDRVLDEETAADLLEAALEVGKVRELVGAGAFVVWADIQGSGGESYRMSVRDHAVERVAAGKGEAGSDYQVRMDRQTAFALVNAPEPARIAACLLAGGHIAVSASSFFKQFALKTAFSGLIGDIAKCDPPQAGDSYTWNGATGFLEPFTGTDQSGWVFAQPELLDVPQTFICTLGALDEPELRRLVPTQTFVDTVAMLGDLYLTQSVRTTVLSDFSPTPSSVSPSGTPQYSDEDLIDAIVDEVETTGVIPLSLPLPTPVFFDDETLLVVDGMGVPVGVVVDGFDELLPTEALRTLADMTFTQPPGVASQDPDLLAAAALQDAELTAIRSVLLTNPRLAGGGGAIVRPDAETPPPAAPAEPSPPPAGSGPEIAGPGSPYAAGKVASRGVNVDEADAGALDATTASSQGLAFILGVMAAKRALERLREGGLVNGGADS